MQKPSIKLSKPRTLSIPIVALRSVTSKSGLGVYASSDTLFKGAVFGRDSLEVAEDLMRIRPKLVRQILLTMVRLQGQKTNKQSNEEPGKIIHEFRQLKVDGKIISKEMLDIFNKLASKWGSDEEELAHYGSIDATPLFLKVLEEYCQLNGEDFLYEVVKCRDSKTRQVVDAANSATEWILKNLKSSQSGMLEFTCDTKEGIANQVWKDSNEFYRHMNGDPVNGKKPISSIEVQGIVFDSLMAASKLLPNLSTECLQAAYDLRNVVLEKMWLEKDNYFALGTDFDNKGNLRLITTPTANPAALMDSKIFDNLPDDIVKKYITGIIQKIMNYDFLTNAGIRSRSLLFAHIVDYWDYQGSFVSWPKETYDIAKGLRRQGFEQLARQLENRLLNVVLKHRQYPEFVYVDGWDRVLDSTPATQTYGDITVVTSTNNPEQIQAWTVSAILAIVNQRINQKLKIKKKLKAGSWQQELEDEIMGKIPKIKRHLNPLMLQARYPTNKYRLTKPE